MGNPTLFHSYFFTVTASIGYSWRHITQKMFLYYNINRTALLRLRTDVISVDPSAFVEPNPLNDFELSIQRPSWRRVLCDERGRKMT